MNVSSGQPCASICCTHDMVDPSGARCYWNVSFSSEVTDFPKVYHPSWLSKMRSTDLFPINKTTCPGNTVCYSDCITEYNISTYLFGNDMISMNDSIDGGLTCRLDSVDHCFKSHVTDGTKSVISVCKKFFDLVIYWNLTMAEASHHDLNFSYEVSVFAISLPFYVATFFIYTIIPEFKNLHGLMLRSYISCCFGTSLLMLIMFIGGRRFTCNLVMVIFWHFGFLASYFWVNAMSFDIWWTFRSQRKCSDKSIRKKYIIYSIYAWGNPVLIIGVSLILKLDYYMGGLVLGIPTRCWMQERRDMITYLYAPVAIVTVINICLYILTTISIIRQKKATAQCLEGSDSRRCNEEKNRFYLYLKLFILMGLMYITEILPYGTQLPKYISDILNLPQFGTGVVIFIFLVWNDRTKKLLTKHLGMKDWVVTQWMNSVIVRIRTLLRRPPVS